MSAVSLSDMACSLRAYWVDPVAIASGSPRGGAGGLASFILYGHSGRSVFGLGKP